MKTSPANRSAATFTTGSIPAHVARLSGVMILGFLAMTLGQLVEVFYLGLVGKDELAAITFTFALAMALNATARGIGIGGSTLVAQSMGAGRFEECARTVNHSFALVIIFAAVVSTSGQWLAPKLFHLLGARAQVLELTTGYAQIWLLGFPMMGLVMVSNGLIRSYGNATYPGYVMTTGPIVQVTVGPFLIFGLAGLPEMGLEGAAWTFVLSSSCQVIVAGYWFFFRERLFRWSLQGFGTSARHILHVGVPAAATNLIQPVSIGVVTWLLAGYGVAVVAGFGVASRIESVVGMVVIGISTAVVPMVGQNWSAGHFDRVRLVLRVCYVACLVWGLIAATIMWFGAGFFVSLVNDDESLVETAVTFLHIIPFSIGFLGLITIATHAFNALRKPGPALILSVARLLVVYLPMALVASHYYGYVGVFVATAVTNILVGIAAVFWFRRVMNAAAA